MNGETNQSVADHVRRSVPQARSAKRYRPATTSPTAGIARKTGIGRNLAPPSGGQGLADGWTCPRPRDQLGKLGTMNERFNRVVELLDEAARRVAQVAVQRVCSQVLRLDQPEIGPPVQR